MSDYTLFIQVDNGGYDDSETVLEYQVPDTIHPQEVVETLMQFEREDEEAAAAIGAKGKELGCCNEYGRFLAETLLTPVYHAWMKWCDAHPRPQPAAMRIEPWLQERGGKPIEPDVVIEYGSVLKTWEIVR